MRRRTIVSCALLSGLGLLAGQGDAQAFKQPEETLPGFKAHSVFEGRGIENLSLFNGDPQLAVPLGPEYPLGYGTSFQLKAYYSTRFWHMYQTQCGSDEYGVPMSHGRARVRGLPTLGVGWTLELGAVDPAPWPEARTRYFAEDGRIHEFVEPAFGVLQEPEDGGPIRLSKRPGGGYVIHFADGTTHWLTHQYQRPDPRAGWGNTWDFTDVDGAALARRTTRWGLKQIRDRNNDVVAEVDWDGLKPWRMQAIKMPDSSRRIVFHWTTHRPSGQSVDWDVVGSVDFPVLANSGSPLNVVMTYRASGRFQRSAFEEYWRSGCESQAPTDVHLPFLASITQHTDVTSFAYVLDGVLPSEYGLDTAAGVLSSYTLPNGLNVRFFYQRSTAPIPCLFGTRSGCMELDEPAASVGEVPTVDPADRLTRLQGYLDRAPAVVSRTETDPTSGGLTATTSYERKQFAQPVGTQGDEARQRDPSRVLRRVIVRRPSGNGGLYATRHVFHVLTEPVAGWTGWGEEPVTSGPGLEVERRAYASSPARGTPVRSNVMCYEGTFAQPYVIYCGALDGSGAIAEFPQAFSHMQASRELTWYGPDPDGVAECRDDTATEVACHYVTRTGWDKDSLEFETVTVGAPRQGPSTVLLQGGHKSRRTSTTWNPRSGTEPWLHWQPKLFSSRTVEDVHDGPCPSPPCSVTTTAQFDHLTGKLLSATVGDANVSRTTTLGYSTGDPTWETVSGAGLSGTYSTQRSFQTGLLTSSRRMEPSDLGWYQHQVTRDPALGLVAKSYDPNGRATTYSWDALGRLEGIQPAGEASTEICYSPWSASAPSKGARVLVKRNLPAGCGLFALSLPTPTEGSGAAEAFVYDGSGRLAREIRLLPTANSGSYMAVRVTTRNDAGLVSSVSEWTPCGSGSDLETCLFSGSTKLTTYSDFDAFGRPRSVVLPDLTQVRKGYDDWLEAVSGLHIPSTDTRESAWTTRNGVTGHYETVRRDILGRVVAVAEPVLSAPPPTPPAPQPILGDVTSYRLDIHDGIAEVHQPRSTGPTSSYEQVRRFTRNALGFLTSETQPETGIIQHGSFTALGNPRVTWKGDLLLTSTYDPIGRLLTQSSNGQEYLRNVWDEPLTPGGASRGWSRGKLTTSIGQNPYPSAGFDIGFYPGGEIADSYSYLGLGGRLSKKETTLSNGAASTVTSWTYNTLGLVEQERYPRLPHLAGQLVAETRYSAGLPVRVSAEGQDVVRDVRYDPVGGLARYTSGNGVQTIVEPDQSGLPRPRRIRTSNGVFDTGVFTYDSRGNILSMGSDAFTYDGNSRLLTVRYGTLTRGYAYDGWNNLVSKDGMSLGIDVTTNRLTNIAGLPVSYDLRGNVTALSGETYSYDGLDRQVRHDSGTSHWSYLFDSAHERIVKAPPPGNHPQGDAILRRHIARVILQAEGDGPLDIPSTFNDVPADDPERGWIERFRQKGYTNGCGANLFCPDNPTTRAEMAVFLASAMSPRSTIPEAGDILGVGTYNCVPGGTSLFNDVASDHWSCKFIHYIFKHGVTSGCEAPPNRRFCPTDLTTHWMMEVFASRLWPGFAHVPPRATYTFRGAGRQVLTEYADSKVEKDYFYLGARLVGTRLVASNGTVSWNYHSTDHLGSVRYTMNAAGGSVQSRKFWPWGEELGSGGPGRLGFAGMEIDTEASRPRYYVHARNLETGIGRFLAPDQLTGRPEDPLSWNRYTYARNNPLNRVDPDGRLDQVAYDYYLARSTTEKAAGAAGVQAFDSGLTYALGAAVAGYFGIAAAAEFLPMAAAAAPGLPDIAGRARDIHSALRSPVTRDKVTTAVATVERATGEIVVKVASSEKVLRPAQIQALRAGEQAVKGAGHAEATIINGAKAAGETVRAVAASRPICPTCAQIIRDAGATAATPLRAVRPEDMK